MATQQAPDFTLEHVTGRQVSLNDYRGKPVILIFSGRNTEEQARSVERDIRSRHTSDEVAIISVADVHGVPRLLRSVAKRDIEKAYNKAAQDASKNLQAQGKVVPSDMSHVVVLVLDWDGKAVAGYGAGSLDKQIVGVLVDANGGIKGRAEGAQAGEQLSSLIG